MASNRFTRDFVPLFFLPGFTIHSQQELVVTQAALSRQESCVFRPGAEVEGEGMGVDDNPLNRTMCAIFAVYERP